MSVLEEKKIIIKLPSLHWRSFFTLRSLLIFLLLALSSASVYWYRNIHPYLWISSAHLETYSTILSSDVSGRIVEMGPQEGDKVKKGQTLFVFDRDLILAKQAQAKQSLDFLNNQIEIEKERIGKAMEAYLTASSELELGIGSPDQVKKQLALMDEAQENTETASSKLTAAKTELGIFDLQLKKMVFTAPFDGIILKRSQNPGAVVSFGDPIYILSDPNRVWIETEIPENEIGNISIGTSAHIHIAAYPKKKLIGKISYIGPATVAKSSLLPLSSQKETIPIKISLENPDACLKPGLSAKVALKVR